MVPRDTRKDDILKLIKEENRTPKSLSEEYDIPLKTIYTWIRTEKINAEKRLRDKVVQLYTKENKTPQEISEETGVVLSVIYTWLNYARVEIRKEDQIGLETSERDRFNQSKLETIRVLTTRIKELEERNRGLQDSIKYLTELLRIKEDELNRNK